MTIRELYAWAEEKGALDLDIEIFRGQGEGFEDCDYPELGEASHDYNTPTVVIL